MKITLVVDLPDRTAYPADAMNKLMAAARALKAQVTWFDPASENEKTVNASKAAPRSLGSRLRGGR